MPIPITKNNAPANERPSARGQSGESSSSLGSSVNGSKDNESNRVEFRISFKFSFIASVSACWGTGMPAPFCVPFGYKA